MANPTVKYWRERFWDSECARLEKLGKIERMRKILLKLEKENRDLHFEIARIKE